MKYEKKVKKKCSNKSELKAFDKSCFVFDQSPKAKVRS